jgi:hypothetical protein
MRKDAVNMAESEGFEPYLPPLCKLFLSIFKNSDEKNLQPKTHGLNAKT